MKMDRQKKQEVQVIINEVILSRYIQEEVDQQEVDQEDSFPECGHLIQVDQI